MSVQIDQGKCTACGSCASTCPVEAIRIEDATNKAKVDDSTCLECGACIGECPVDAISS
ncbi:MAG: 4Fe-4S binding protein [Planctomycetaceae bacterium]|jgi:ferredoxin|nr:4Fe-4S binding protein [Planctomycetaceae bacterium]